MNSVFSIAVSGMNAAIHRMSNAATNLVNISSTGKVPENAGEKATSYQPTDVISLSNSVADDKFGVRTETVPRTPAFSYAYNPDSPDANADGLIAVPNVSIEREIVDSLLAEIAYKASAKVIAAEKENQDKLLDTLV